MICNLNQTLKIHIEDSVADQARQRLSSQGGELPVLLTTVDSLQEVQGAPRHRDDPILWTTICPTQGFDCPGPCATVPMPPFCAAVGAIGELAAVDIMRLGISDYLLKDQINGLPHVIKRAVEVHEARRARRRAALQLAESEKAPGRADRTPAHQHRAGAPHLA